MLLLKIFDILIGLVIVVCGVVASIIAIFLIAASFELGTRGDFLKGKSIHTGKYENGKRVGKWELRDEYRLGNGNDGVNEQKGSYERGLRNGIWTIKTPYYLEMHTYENGILRESISGNQKVEIDSDGKVIFNGEPTKADCQRLYDTFGYYRTNDMCYDLIKGESS